VTDAITTIRARRAESNAAIAARDADRVVGIMMPDIIVAVAGGPTLTGRAASRDAFAGQFSDRNFRGYVRTPATVTVAAPPVRALERGRWVGTWVLAGRERAMHGTYLAEWQLTAMGWFLSAESFVEEADP
jgi:ketosteroid isomerase-like protein